ncbi:hypothetical protein IWW36_003443 [Coemansia brasiliensis]|uniref:Chitosanase n=1 Tax=Coemansia brasiliensis TaxID=2650707 RepID=A0A9W8M029_9FUNG|nr:hypothetical protein IWW36_003443 [Coemansia brasiliensis]
MLRTRNIILFVIGIVSVISSTTAALCGCSKDIALRLTNIYENGDTDFHYDYCENIEDGRGFTAGIAGFCTGTGDAWEVIQAYHKLTGGKDDFSPMDSVLQKYAEEESDSTSGLEDYCSVWEKLGKSDKKFQQAQDSIRDNLYYNPSQKEADKLGLKFDISRGEMYDTGIQHGTSDDADGLSSLIKYTNEKFTSDQTGDSGSTLSINGKKVDEIEWLKKFIEVRDDDLKNPKESYNQGGNVWADDTYRTKSYTYMIDAGTYMFSKSAQALDNDGNPITIKCEKESNLRRPGIAGFCTGTGDAWEVIQAYHKLTGGKDDFSSMDSVLQKYAEGGDDSTSGLEDYCSVWEKLGKSDVKFQQAQDSVRDSNNLNPSQKLADEVGLKFDVSRGQMYDTGIQMGTGDDADGLSSLIKYTNEEFTSDQTGDSGSTLDINGKKVDEIVWLKKFIEVRENELKNPKEKDNQAGDAWAATLYRTKSYSYIVDAGTYMFGTSIKALDNDGNPVTQAKKTRY